MCPAVRGGQKNCPWQARPRYWGPGFMRRNDRQVWWFRGFVAVLLAMTFGYVPYRLYSRSGLARYLERRRDLTALQAQNERLRGDIDRLTREAESLRSDVRAVERIARLELNWVRAGEVIFDLGKAAP